MRPNSPAHRSLVESAREARAIEIGGPLRANQRDRQRMAALREIETRRLQREARI